MNWDFRDTTLARVSGLTLCESMGRVAGGGLFWCAGDAHGRAVHQGVGRIGDDAHAVVQPGNNLDRLSEVAPELHVLQPNEVSVIHDGDLCPIAPNHDELAVHHLNGSTERRVLATASELREALEGSFRLTLPEAPELDEALGRLIAPSV